MRRVILLLTTILISLTIKAQLAVTNVAPYDIPGYLVNNVLLGSGVTATNITFSGDPNQLGYFSNGLAGAINPLALDSGIVLSTGNVNDIPGAGFISSSFSGPGDPDLLSIAQSLRPGISSTNDAAILEFDFVPDGDTVEFRFVFASEEYPNYINQDFQDIFSFFISGPGFTGLFASPPAFPNGSQNLAVVPGTPAPGTPITIGTINHITNTSFYIDNVNENTFGFNGYTIPISIKFHVTCNVPYHFKFAIADCQDFSFDTGVFMEGSSFSSNAPIAIQFSTASIGGDSTIIEGCEGATLNLTRSDTAGDVTLHYTIGGSATNGVDYTFIADSVTYLSGIDTASITIIPLTDAFLEGQESITITTTSINACGNVIVSADSLYINDVPILTSTSSHVNLVCPADSIPISVAITGAPDDFTYIWTDSQGNTYADTANIFVQALQTDTFYVNATGHCPFITISDTIIVTVTPLFILTTTQSDTNICQGDVIDFVTTPSVIGTYTYNWMSTLGNALASAPPLDSLALGSFSIEGSDTVFITVNNGGVGCTVIDTLLVNIAQQPNINITTLDTLLECVSSSSSLPINVDLGTAPSPNDFSFDWSFPTTLNDSTVQNPNAIPTQGITDYIVTVTDTLGGCFDTDTVEVRSCCIQFPSVLSENSTCFGLDNGKIITSAVALNSDYTTEFHKNDALFTLLQTSSGNLTDSIINLEPGSYIVLLFDTIGCSFSDTLTLTEPFPIILSGVTPDSTICIDGTATLYGTGTGATPPINLIWNNGLVGNGPHLVNPIAFSSLYTVYAQDANNCVSPTQNIIITLRDSIKINNITLSDNTICEGNSTTIFVNATGGGTGLIYTWLNGNGSVIGATSANQFIVTPIFDGEIFSVIVSDSCTTPTVTDSILTDLADVVLPTYVATDYIGCFDKILPVFTNTTITPSVITNVEWDFGDGSVFNLPFSTQIPHAYDQPGLYDVTLTVTDGTGCIWDTVIADFQVDAHGYPVADFVWNPNPTDYLNAQITFDNYSTGNVFNEWLFITDASYTSNDIDPVFQFPQDQPGNYDVTLTVTNKFGCRDSVSKVVVIDDVFLFYIPTAFTPDGDGLNDSFKVVGEGLDLNNFKMSIFNKWGELVFQSSNTNVGWDGTYKGSNVPDGVYIWKIEAKEAHSSIVQKKDGFITIVR